MTDRTQVQVAASVCRLMSFRADDNGRLEDRAHADASLFYFVVAEVLDGLLIPGEQD